MALANPGFANEITNYGAVKSGKTCITCSSCTQMMRDGTTSGCVIHDSDVYAPIYYQGRMKDIEYVRSFAENCRSCIESPCKANCPANIDIP
jgi:Fe-S-cluster-containing dehydrogenase component